VIGPNGEQIGVLPFAAALQRAQEAQLDLVEVAPTAQPPVVKIMDYGRYKYEQAKRDRQAHRKSRGGDLKGMRLSPNIGQHDFQVKTQRVHGFLQDGNKVRVALWFRGRQMAYPKIGEALLQRLAQALADVGVVESPPRLEGRNMIMVLTPRKT
jgi:translation initiation factor IF-3